MAGGHGGRGSADRRGEPVRGLAGAPVRRVRRGAAARRRRRALPHGQTAVGGRRPHAVRRSRRAARGRAGTHPGRQSANAGLGSPATRRRGALVKRGRPSHCRRFAVGADCSPRCFPGGPGLPAGSRTTSGGRCCWVLPATPMLLALAAGSAAVGALLARQAPVLLGPTPADRLAAAERRATELAERNRLARELHDSVGHALSAVTLQAGAARKVLDSGRAADVEFVREALAAIEETTRRTVGELDAVLGLLRQDGDGEGRLDGPTLTALEGLLSRSGVSVTLHTRGTLTAVAAPVSREAYRIVQEGLSNALRHAGASPVTLWIGAGEEELEIRMENPVPERAPVQRPGGGRGLRGVAERAALLGGQAAAGPDDGVWRLSARLPLAGRR
ncbi:predicted protein [Streptomyces pristinaespiralis ATCC 25486]|uniref:histidine kinase n=1 Tax=Streptomyces pristinaespiralis (strain ATCC 25486 / DSM 40338 / CBS 914.69 / JCM 4507 / KCC S-0507 / NBRC 13074 / NRRL 2958 / 5647) TaxID=457429 RepID=D6X9C1_STRE2|nr:predicted protein [Streptomyces pristinaespiralis ATCC 25486]